MVGYEAWIKSDPKEENYPENFRAISKKIKDDFLTKDVLLQMSNDDLYDKIFKYSRKLEGPAFIRLGEQRIRGDLDKLRRNLMYLITSKDSPFVVAQNILEGKFKIEVFAKAFWSPILLAQFPDVLPNWNNKTENFLKKFGINISTSKLSIAEKYKILSEAFTLLSGLNGSHDFYSINHLMHFGTVIPEGIQLIDNLKGIETADPVKIMIRKYKDKIRKTKLKDELYKWELIKKYHGRPDLNVDDFPTEIKSIDYSNLIYPMAKAVRNHLADTVSVEYRACLIKLFNEEEDLIVRIKEFNSDMTIAYQKSEGRHEHQHDERTIATFLTYHTPNKYTFFKNSYYQDYCKMTGVEPKAKGEKYSHYLELVADFRERYILPDPELISLVNGFMNPDCFADENHLVLVQDILYQMLSKEGDEPMDVVEEEKVEIPKLDKNMPSIQLNTILYGSPGTGKTFHSISHAVAIIENKPVDLIIKEDRVLVKARFDQYVLDGQIVFCTFHQSMGYEDFIEGIKPTVSSLDAEESDEDQLSYTIEDGIFKRLCTEASFSFIQQNLTSKTEKVLDFSSEYDRYVDIVNERFAAGKKNEMLTISGQKLFIESISQKNNIIIRHINGTRSYIVSKQRLIKISQAFADLSEVTNINEQFRGVIGGSNASAYWSVLNAIRKLPSDGTLKQTKTISEKKYTYEDKKGIIESLNNNDYKIANPKKYVLVIDEINRGNVSQIFGELITLIEEDKRLGKTEALKAILPYSKYKFGVPCNLHIIGTMNTADRSVEALDTALRRRFSFVLMMPEPDLLKITKDGISLPKILTVLNSRLTILKDIDHTIGHAWLWDVTNIHQLKEVFGNKILPLLQEYFYNDYEKLGLVLGDAFFKPYVQVNSTVFAAFSGGNGLSGQYDQTWQYQLKPSDELTIENFKSLEFLNNQATAGE